MKSELIKNPTKNNLKLKYEKLVFYFILLWNNYINNY